MHFYSIFYRLLFYAPDGCVVMYVSSGETAKQSKHVWKKVVSGKTPPGIVTMRLDVTLKNLDLGPMMYFNVDNAHSTNLSTVIRPGARERTHRSAGIRIR